MILKLLWVWLSRTCLNDNLLTLLLLQLKVVIYFFVNWLQQQVDSKPNIFSKQLQWTRMRDYRLAFCQRGSHPQGRITSIWVVIVSVSNPAPKLAAPREEQQRSRCVKIGFDYLYFASSCEARLSNLSNVTKMQIKLLCFSYICEKKTKRDKGKKEN